MKVCRGCGRELPESNFYRASHAPDGYLPFCKVCFNLKYKQSAPNHTVCNEHELLTNRMQVKLWLMSKDWILNDVPIAGNDSLVEVSSGVRQITT